MAFNHILDIVLGRGDGTPLKSALDEEGIDDIFGLTTLTDAAIDSLQYKDSSNNDVLTAVKLGDKMLLRCFLSYVSHCHSEGMPIGDNWDQVSQSEFDAYRIDPRYMSPIVPKVNVPSSTAATKTVGNSGFVPHYSPADMFRRGIKRDSTLFPTLKDEKFNDSWHRSFVNQARAQDVSEVLDPSYVPSTASDQELFTEKQKYVYAVLESKVLTDRGKAIVREFETTFYAQKVYKRLTEHHLKSTKARIESSTILSYVTSVRLGNGEWNGTTEGFITHWTNQVRLYERQVPASDHFSDGQKRVMLENAVAPIAELRQVKNNADLEQTKTGKALTYDEYFNLLLSAATAYDIQFAKKPKRNVFMHNFGDYSDDYIPDHDVAYDIDAPVSSLLAHTTERRNKGYTPSSKPGVRMPSDKWFSLDTKSKEIWDQLDDKAKSIILGYDSKGPAASSTPARNHSNMNFQRKVNLHDISAFDLLHAYSHEMENSVDDTEEQAVVDVDNGDTDPPDIAPDDNNDTRLINAAKSSSSSKFPPGDIRRVVSKASKRFVNKCEYFVSAHTHINHMSLVDRGANGGVAGNDVRVLFKTNRTVDIRGIDNHQLTDVPIGTVGGVVTTQKGPVIAIMHQYALLGKGSSIHSPCQLESYKNDVNDKSVHVQGGSQQIKTLDGYSIPLVIKSGLARLPIRPFTDAEWDSLPHVFLTAEAEWDPTVVDHEFQDDEPWGDDDPNTSKNQSLSLFDEFGNYRNRYIVQFTDFFERHEGSTNIEDVIDQCVYYSHAPEVDNLVFYDAHEHEIDGDADEANSVPTIIPRVTTKREPDYASLRPLFGWLSPDIIKKTFENTTQYARIPTGTLLKKTFKSPNPALNVARRNEAVACDIVYSDTPAVNDGSTAAVMFVGLDSQVTDIYGIKTDKQFVNTLEDQIVDRGAPHKLISDGARVIISDKIVDILRTLCIKSWQSEPYQQQQNPAERRYQTLKTAANRIMDRTGAPPKTWLLCLQYACFLLNHTYNSTVGNVPLVKLTGNTVDISVLLRFHFWEKVYYKAVRKGGFPSKSTEEVGHIVGISEHCGHALTWKVLTYDTNVVIYRSLVRPFTPADCNLRAESLGGEDMEYFDPADDPIIKSPDGDIKEGTKQISTQSNPQEPNISTVFNPEDLVGKTFLMDTAEDGQKVRARIVKLLQDHEGKVEDNPTRLKFLLSVNNDEGEEVITYNKLLDYISKDEENPVVWKFRRIVSHKGPIKPSHPEYKGSPYNLMIEWETGEITSEPLQTIATDDPVTCAFYGKENNLLDQPGWKRFKKIAKRDKMFTRMINQAKLRSFNTSTKYKYGFEVPRNYKHALLLDEKNGNNLWKDAVALELQQINEYQTFEDKGHHTKTVPPNGYKKIRVHFVFDVKHDGRHKARLVADGHLTDIPLDSVYSGVVSIKGFRLVIFLAELNKLGLWATDIGNAYLEAYTSEKVYIVAGPEFSDLEGHILIISRALYGLRSSGARWHDRLADCMRELGFFSCKAEPDIWMRQNGSIYEYVAVYVDDLAIAMKDPKEFISILEGKYKFKTKGSGPLSFHLGMNFHRDDDGTLCITSLKYIEKMVSNYEKIFGEPPKQVVTSPLEKGDHPELDTSELLDAKGIELYQSLIGALQWSVTIGRFDVNTAVMTLSGFRVAPRRGHLDRVKRVYGYLAKMRHAAIRVRTDEPDYSDIPDFEYDWAKTVYGEIEEMIPEDAPIPLGKFVTMSHYVDANLMHDVTTGKSVTGILHLVNKTPLEWYSKKQPTVETATYGSEFVAARTCVEQIIDLRTTLRYLGVPIRSKSYMFGDNKSVVDSSMQINAKLHKRHTILSFHRVRECIAAKMVGFYFIPGESNPADILSKHWGYSQVWTRLKTLLFWKGDTNEIDE